MSYNAKKPSETGSGEPVSEGFWGISLFRADSKSTPRKEEKTKAENCAAKNQSRAERMTQRQHRD